MEIKDARIDGGKPFDWGRTAADYARYRDIYPPEFYRAILDRGVGLAGQQVLGTRRTAALTRSPPANAIGIWIRLERLGSLPGFFLRGARCCCW